MSSQLLSVCRVKVVAADAVEMVLDSDLFVDNVLLEDDDVDASHEKNPDRTATTSSDGCKKAYASAQTVSVDGMSTFTACR
jgi:hypothetical protein